MNKFYAFVLLKVEVGKIPPVVNKLYSIKEIREIFMVTGPFDLLVILETNNFEEIGTLIAEKISKIGGIEDTQTMIAFRTYKYLEK
jgi:anthranilate phosphoribosyltransferase